MNEKVNVEFTLSELELIHYCLKWCYTIELERAALLNQGYHIMKAIENNFDSVLYKIKRSGGCDECQS